MTEIRISAKSSGKKPDYKKTAAALLEKCRSFYQDPENEREFREWKAQREREGKSA